MKKKSDWNSVYAALGIGLFFGILRGILFERSLPETVLFIVLISLLSLLVLAVYYRRIRPYIIK